MEVVAVLDSHWFVCQKYKIQFLYFSKRTPAQVIRVIANESEADEESNNELYLPEVNNNIATPMSQPDQLDNSPEDPEAIEKHSSKWKKVAQDSKGK